MNIDIQNVSDTRKTLVISLDQTEVAARHQEVIGKISKVARIPGFRVGKAPVQLITKRYAKEIDSEFKQELLGKAYKDALKQSKLDVIEIVNVEDVALPPDQAVTITITVDLQPQFELPEYTGIPTKIESTEPTDEEVQAEIDALRSREASFSPAERPAQKGDYVKLAYTGRIEDKPILEIAPDKQIYGSVPQTWEEVESGQDGIIPGLNKALSGLAKGDKKEVTINFPSTFAQVPALAGKTAIYAVEILEIRERTLPELDEAFFKANNAKDLADLTEQVKARIKRSKEYRNISAQRDQVTKALIEKVSAEMPESLVKSQSDQMLRYFLETNLNKGAAPEDFEKNKVELVNQARAGATERVKLHFILSKIAEKESIKVDPRDIESYLRRESTMQNVPVEKLAKDLTKNREHLRSIHQNIILDKVLDLIVSKAKVSTADATA